MTPFVVGGQYTRDKIYLILEVPPERQRGDWNTGYHIHDGVAFIFANVGIAARTGHDHDNQFDGEDLIWHGKGKSQLSQPQIQKVLAPSTTVHIFFRTHARDPFTYAGVGTAVDVVDTTPVQVRCSFRADAQFHPERTPGEVTVAQRFEEGDMRTVQVDVRERNPAARRACIEHFGAACQVCGMDFAAAYGPIAEGFIHVHHINPLGNAMGVRELNPVRDLRPVCPNCHAMLHTEFPPVAIEKLKELITGRRAAEPRQG
ncbi:MAG TPA: HNH endonuclease [Polyangiaceae bacterium]|nr:HNH endonuclease [Polyangiaceae bacterium]